MRLIGLVLAVSLSLSALGSPVTILYEFVKDDNGRFINGQNPNALVRDDAGNLYGSSQWSGTLPDGSEGKGTIFKLDGATGQLSVLHTFNGTSDGSNLYGKLVLDSQGNLYGTARDGGDNDFGTLFRVSSNIPLTVLRHFNEVTDGSSPFGLVSDGKGDLWGAAGSGGLGYGTIFKYNETDGLTVAYSFDKSPPGLLTGPSQMIWSATDKVFYGVSSGGVNGSGAVFKFNPTDNSLTTAYSLDADSHGMAGLLVQDDSGNLYGTIANNNTHPKGAVFKLQKQQNDTFAYSVLHDFKGAPNDGFLPWGGLVFGNDGYLYGTTQLGGANNLGTVFRLDLAPDPARITILHSFSGGDGSSPLVEMYLGSDGNLYGTTNNGGFSDGGTIFKLLIVKPIITVPAPITAEATGPNGRNVTFNVTATGADTVNCDPPSGSQFKIGETEVTCTATNPAGETTKTFIVKVEDTTPPTLTCPSSVDFRIPSESSDTTANVSFPIPPSAIDLVDGATAVTCSKPSGSSFPIGTTANTCTTHDTAGNQSQCQFNVNVTKIPLPTITVPAPITAEATGPNGRNVTFNVTVAGANTVNCDPPSGSQFKIGDTQVTCRATNDGGTTTETFIVTVKDTTPPTLTCPTKVTKTLPGDSTATSAEVTFERSSQDAVDSAPTLTCSKDSGSTFDLGTTTVTCNTSDGSGNQANCEFSVEVRKADENGCNSQIKGSSPSFFIFFLFMMALRFLSYRRSTRQSLLHTEIPQALR